MAGAAVWLTLQRIARGVFSALPPSDRFRPTARGVLYGTGWLIAILLSVPWSTFRLSGPRIDWGAFGVLASGIDACLPLLVVCLLALVARVIGSPRPGASASRGSYRFLRDIAVLIAIVGLLTPTATVGGLPVAFLVGWLLIEVWLLPRQVRAGAVATGDQPRRAAREAVVDQARAAAESRATSALERGLRKDLAAEGLSPEDREERLDKLRAMPLRQRIDSDAFSTYAGESPWRRARVFALVGLLTGLPWMLLDIGALFAGGNGMFLLLDGASGLLVLLRFAIAGFVAGLAYPMIRGHSGLAKGLAVFVTLAVPGLCVNLLPDPYAPGVASAALLQLAQWLTFGLIFGLVADLRQLRAAGLGWRSLSDVHNLTALTASFSSVALAAVTATVTAIGTGAAGVMVERLLPPAPPAATTPAGK